MLLQNGRYHVKINMSWKTNKIEQNVAMNRENSMRKMVENEIVR